jgi:hypothetical protein
MKDRLDELLAEALVGYVPESRAGLERRILLRVRFAGIWPRFIWPLVAAAAMVICLVVPRQERVPTPLPVAVAAVRVEVGLATQPVRKPVMVRRVGLPKRATFPSPTGLTDGERALLRLMQQHPDLALEVSKFNAGLLDIRPLPLEADQ